MKTQNPILNFATLPKLLFIFGLIGLMGCSPVKFTAGSDCDGDESCISGQGYNTYSINESVSGGKVDVLIVNDNSASMSYEQTQFAQRFNQFLAQFEQRSIDYRMAITTTDISSAQNPPRSVNQHGALQDGKLIAFSNGSKYLTPGSGSASQKDEMFNIAMKRSETLACEQFVSGWTGSRDSAAYNTGYYNACPSTDERGTWAASLVVQNNPDGFIRPEADLAIIFLADEDVRSQTTYGNVSDEDKGVKMVERIKAKYPQKTLGAHAIIVKDASCMQKQNTQLNGLVSASYGWEYHNAAQATGGVSGDICATDYTQQLLGIFNNIQGRILDKIALNCEGVNLEWIENVTTVPSDASIIPTVVGNTVQFNKKIPSGYQVKGKYKCKQTAT